MVKLFQLQLLLLQFVSQSAYVVYIPFPVPGSKHPIVGSQSHDGVGGGGVVINIPTRTIPSKRLDNTKISTHIN